jgi:hypothetical protein
MSYPLQERVLSNGFAQNNRECRDLRRLEGVLGRWLSLRIKCRVWTTIRLGACKDTDTYRNALKKTGVNISKWADETLGRMDIATIETEVVLVRVFSAQLGFTKAVRRDAIYARAYSLGLEPCTPEIGPRLREEYTDQPNGEWLLIGMNPIPVPGSYSELFVLERDDDGSLWLNSLWALSGLLWSPESRWVFTLPRE